MKSLPLCMENVIPDEKGNLWFSAVNCAGVFCISPDEHMASFRGRLLEQEKMFLETQYICAGKYQTKLFFAPCGARDIKIFDIDSGIIRTISLHLPELRNALPGTKEYPAFRYFYREAEYLWLIPQAAHSILEINMKSEEVKIHKQWYESLKNMTTNIFLASLVIENCICMLCYESNQMIIFRMDTNENEIYEIGTRQSAYSCMAFDADGFWLLDYKNNILVLWKPDTGIKEVYDFPNVRMTFGDFREMISFGNELYLIPNIADKFWVFRKQDSRFEILYTKPQGSQYYNANYIDKETLFLGDKSSAKSILFSPKTENFLVYPIYCSWDELEVGIFFGTNGDNDGLESEKLYIEDANHHLGSFIKSLF